MLCKLKEYVRSWKTLRVKYTYEEFVRLIEGKMVCPRCHKHMGRAPFTSRRFTKPSIKICAACGNEEAYIDAGLTDNIEHQAYIREQCFINNGRRYYND